MTAANSACACVARVAPDARSSCSCAGTPPSCQSTRRSWGRCVCVRAVDRQAPHGGRAGFAPGSPGRMQGPSALSAAVPGTRVTTCQVSERQKRRIAPVGTHAIGKAGRAGFQTWPPVRICLRGSNRTHTCVVDQRYLHPSCCTNLAAARADAWAAIAAFGMIGTIGSQRHFDFCCFAIVRPSVSVRHQW